MSFYPVLIFIHVVWAVLGLGSLTAAAVLTTWSANLPPPHIPRLLRIVSVSLAGILATGVGIIAMTPGALGETRWMKIAFALFLLLGLLHGIVSNQFRRARRGGQSALSSGLLAGMLWTMCGIVVAIPISWRSKLRDGRRSASALPQRGKGRPSSLLRAHQIVFLKPI